MSKKVIFYRQTSQININNKKLLKLLQLILNKSHDFSCSSLISCSIPKRHGSNWKNLSPHVQKLHSKFEKCDAKPPKQNS